MSQNKKAIEVALKYTLSNENEKKKIRQGNSRSQEKNG